MHICAVDTVDPIGGAHMLGRMSITARPITLGSLRAENECIEVRCIKCGRGRTIACIDLPMPDDFPFPELQTKFRCTGCGNRNGEKPGWHYINVWIGKRVHAHEVDA